MPEHHSLEHRGACALRFAMQRAPALIMALALVACGSTEGQLLVRRTPADGGAAVAGPADAIVRPNMSLQYQITGRLDLSVDAELFVVDLFDTDAAEVAALHAAGRRVIAYVSVGSLESFRDDAGRLPGEAVGRPLATYPDEAWLDHRHPGVRALLEQRLDAARDKGFDGVFASTLGAYRANSGFMLTRADELDYAAFLSRAAHARALRIGLSGTFELAPELVSLFDFAIAVGCIARGDCEALSPLLERGKPVFGLETEGELADVCAKAAGLGFPVVLKRPSYDAYRAVCP